jgi:hypothetical protein
MWNASPALAVLIDGVVEWSSGHALPCRAVLYSIGETGVRPTWKLDTASLQVLADPHGEAFTVIYHDEKRHRSTGDFRLTSVVEVYIVNPGGLERIVRRIY